MDLAFYKLRVSSSDLILLDDLDGGGRDRDWPSLAQAIVDRRRGAGAARLAVLSRSGGELWLRVFDRRGSEEGARFDAALAAGRYLLDSGRAGSERLRLRSGLGEFAVDVLDGSSLGLELGPPLGLPEREPIDATAAASRVRVLETGGERYELLPLGLSREPGQGGAPAEASSRVVGPAAVAAFHQGGARKLTARIASAERGVDPPPALPVRVIAKAELRASLPADPRLDAVSAAAIALAAAAAIGAAASEAVVALGGEPIWLEWTPRGGLYAAARPRYVYRGEWYWEEGKEGVGRSESPGSFS